MVVETDNFLELDYSLLVKILKSCELLITSEVEVYKAADTWLNFDIENRRKFAKDLLLKVRLPLLSVHTLNHLLSKSSSFTDIDECISIVKTILVANTECFEETSCTSYSSRYCNQKNFSTILISGYSWHHNQLSKNVNQINANNFKDVKPLSSMIEERRYSKGVCLKGEVYVFSGYNDNFKQIKSVEKYSPSTASAWNKVAYMYDDRENFCVCGFMDKIYVIGGYYDDRLGYATDTCLVLETNNYGWKDVAAMKEARGFAACAVFEESIVVTGGWDNNGNDLNTVEKYDATIDEWSPMPDLIEGKRSHSLVVVKNKLYVIGYGTDACEVFENSCKKFVAIKSPRTGYLYLNQAISIGSKIVAFQDEESSLFCFDVDKDEWSEEYFEVTKNLGNFSCVKLPWY